MTFKMRLMAYEPNGALLGPLPTPEGMTASIVYGDVGTLDLDYSRSGPGAPWLESACEVAVHVDTSAGWVEATDARFVMLADQSDEIVPEETPTYTGFSYGWLLGKALVDEGSAQQMKEGKRHLGPVSAGSLMRTFTSEAQARGVLTGADFSHFTANTDSAGKPWSFTLDLGYEVGIDLGTVLRNLIDQGVCEARWQGRSLYLYDSESSAVDRTLGDDPIVLRRGRDIVEAPLRRTRENLASIAIVRGDGGKLIKVTNPEAEKPWGDWETAISQGGVSDDGTLVALGQNMLDRVGETRSEHTHGLSFADAKWLPLVDYQPGDWVFTDRTGTPERLRVRQVTIATDQEGVPTGNVVLNDRLLEAEVALTRRVVGIVGGSTAGGGSGAIPTPPEDEPVFPSPPTGVTLGSSIYFDPAGAPLAQVTVSWTAPTTGDAVVKYRIYARRSDRTSWSLMGEADGTATVATISPFDPGSKVYVGVSSVSAEGRESTRAVSDLVTLGTDQEAPPAPSQPQVSVRLGVVSVSWDGKNAGDVPMVRDFAYVEVHSSTTNDFTPSAATLVDTLDKPGRVIMPAQEYNSTWCYRLVAVDTSGNKSAPSPQNSQETTPLVDADIIGKVLDGANLQDGTVATEALVAESVTAEKIAALAITADKIEANAVTADKIEAGAVTAEKIEAGAITAEKIDAGAVTADKIGAGELSADIVTSGRLATALTGGRVELNGDGLFAYDDGGVQTVAINKDGSVKVSGVYRTATSGARIEMSGSTENAWGSTAGVLAFYRGTEGSNPNLNRLGPALIKGIDRGLDTFGNALPMGLSLSSGAMYWQTEDVGRGHIELTEEGTRVLGVGLGVGSGAPRGTNFGQWYRTTSASIPSGSWVRVGFDIASTATAIHEDNGPIHPDAGTFMSYVEGLYILTASVFWSSNTAGYRAIRIVTEGDSVIARTGWQASSTPFRDLGITAVMGLKGGGYAVHVEVFQNSGTTLSLLGNSSEAPVMARFGQIA